MSALETTLDFMPSVNPSVRSMVIKPGWPITTWVRSRISRPDSLGGLDMLDGASGSATDGSTAAPETSSSSQHTTQPLNASIRSSATMNAPPNGAYTV
eukprot:6877976-Prymnesium_polylepis.1